MKTLIILILDESGSMQSKKDDILGGFNNFIATQKAIADDTARLYLIKFNTTVTTVYSGIPLESVPDLSTDTYSPGGQTALYDAIAEGVRLADRDKADDERVVAVIMTDGQENSSRETSKAQIRAMIGERESRDDWTFLYIGEEPDRWVMETGMSPGNAIQYNNRTPRENYRLTGIALSRLRSSIDGKNNALFGSD